MNAQVDTNILFPVARIVQGDLYEPQTKDNQGAPLTIKTGPNAGKARVNYFFAIAIPKNPGEVAFWQTPWGAKIYQLTQSWWPAFFDRQTGACNNPRFAWKIEDGDDATPNQNNRRNCDREGFPGHWVVQLGSSFPTKVFDEQGAPLLQAGLVKRGYWVEVYANIASNENAQNPGIYINHSMVAYRAPGKEIVSGPDPRAVGFGRAALPQGVTAQPLGNVANIPNAAPPIPGTAAPGVPGVPGVPSAPGVPATAAAAPTPQAPAPTPVQPHPGFIAPPVPGAAPAVPTAPSAPPPTFVCPLGAPTGFKMVNLNGARYDAFRAQGWADAQLLQAGHMVKL